MAFRFLEFEVDPSLFRLVKAGEPIAVLAEAGTDKSNLISATIWLSDIGTFDEMNAVWDAWVAPDNSPARTCVESKLAAPQFLVEIGIIAALD